MSTKAEVLIDTEKIINDLERMRSAANVHTINKAIFYMRSLSNPVWFISDDVVRVMRFEQHARMCQQAIDSGDVKNLASSMGGYF